MKTVGQYLLEKRLEKDISLEEIGSSINLTATGAIELEIDHRQLKYSELEPLALGLRLNGSEFSMLYKLWKNNKKRQWKQKGA